MDDSAKRPVNVLLITSDQQRGDCYGFEGRAIKTPHMDQLAAEGTRFSACITPNVVCQPSRASILTGLLPRSHGVPDNGIDLDPKVGAAGYAGQFSKAGYETAFLGKAHFSTHNTFEPTGTPECRFSSGDYGDDWFGPYMGFEYVESVVVSHNLGRISAKPHGLHFENRWHANGQGHRRMAEYKTRHPPLSDAAQTWHSGLPPAWHHSSWVGDRTVAYLKEQRDKPFCVWASFPDPHHPFDAPEPWSRMHHPDEVDLPKHRTKDLERRPWWHRTALESVPTIPNEELRIEREKYSRTPEQTDEQLRHLIANYYSMISLIDHNVGRIMVALDELGLRENTLVIYSTDHGDWLGDHGIILKGPMHYEGLLRVGCIARGPGVKAGQIVDEPVSTVDIPATFLDYGKVQPSGTIHGRSLRPLLEGQQETRDFAYNEWDLLATRCGVDLDLRTVRTKTHKLTMEERSGAGELYDLKNDPDEMDNLFDDAGGAAVRKELQDMIRSRPDDVCQNVPPQVGMA